ncbi:MAG: hypothetical protein RIB45_00595 [Marivibrio sp.]|uniref:hypothetical protein n=1 Tax=Marivibrio sp. TaxID=2039719 RepID=UPI0032EC5799
MKLSEIFSAFQRKPALAGDGGADQSSLARTGPAVRSIPGQGPGALGERLPDPPPLERAEDVIDISREAGFVLAASKYDPHKMTLTELQDMAAEMREGGAIGAADYALLMRGPDGGGYRYADADAPRDVIAEWQLRLTDSMAKPDLRAIGANTRALNILGRVAAARGQL